MIHSILQISYFNKLILLASILDLDLDVFSIILFSSLIIVGSLVLIHSMNGIKKGLKDAGKIVVAGGLGKLGADAVDGVREMIKDYRKNGGSGNSSGNTGSTSGNSGSTSGNSGSSSNTPKSGNK